MIKDYCITLKRTKLYYTGKIVTYAPHLLQTENQRCLLVSGALAATNSAAVITA